MPRAHSASFNLDSLVDGEHRRRDPRGVAPNGYDGQLPLGNYRSAPSADFNSGHFRSAINQVLGTEPLPSRSTAPSRRRRPCAEFEIVARVGFVPIVVLGRRQQRNDQRLLHAGDLAGARGRDRHRAGHRGSGHQPGRVTVLGARRRLIRSVGRRCSRRRAPGATRPGGTGPSPPSRP